MPYNGLKQTHDIQKLGLSLAAVVTGLTAIVALLFFRLMSAFIRISETAAHADRLQAMGTLSAGIAHELRNPLGIIRALAEGLRSDFEEETPRREWGTTSPKKSNAWADWWPITSIRPTRCAPAGRSGPPHRDH